MRNILLATAKRKNYSAEYAAHNNSPNLIEDDRKRGRFAKFLKLKNLKLSPVFFIGTIAIIAVPINALFFQDGRHPAPLFTNKFNSTEAKVNLPPPTPPSRSNEIASSHDQLVPTKIDSIHHHPKLTNDSADNLTPARANLSSHKGTKYKENEESKKDEIGHLLAKHQSAQISQDQQVLFVQRALLKLGYVVRANGIWNKATQDALAKFQKDNGLNVKRSITSKLIAFLATRSGLESE